jgi:hypothetical protein
MAAGKSKVKNRPKMVKATKQHGMGKESPKLKGPSPLKTGKGKKMG